MSTQSYLTLGSTLYDIENVEEMKIVQKPNEHGILYLTAIVKESKKDEYLNTIGTLDNIEVGYYTLVENKEEKVTLFKGIVTTPDSEVINGKNAIKIIAKTGSYAMDIKRNFRSFQNKNAMYGDIYKEVFASYGGRFIYDRKNDCKTDRFILQHNETDWEFLKRVASMYNVPLLPSPITGGQDIFIGMPVGDDIGNFTKPNYKIRKDSFTFKTLANNVNNNRTIKELDLVSTFVTTTENYDIGSKAIIDNKETGDLATFYIKEKEVLMYNGVLKFKYNFGRKEGFYQDRIFNKDITGMMLNGKVIDRVNDTVKVHFVDFDGENRENNHYFKYVTPYTADNSTGWYVMPEINDIVFIVCKDYDENNAVADDGYRAKGGGKIGSPNIKYLRTADGREIKLAPDELVITCSNWTNEKTGETEKIYIQLKAGEGVTIMSTKDIHVHAEGDLTLTSDKKVSITAEEEIDIKCKTSEIKLDTSSIKIESPSVKIN